MNCIRRQKKQFMHVGYDLNREPLYFGEVSRRWFSKVVDAEISEPLEACVLLGAVNWMVQLLGKRCKRVHVVDVSEPMLEIALKNVTERSVVEVHKSDWLEFKLPSNSVDMVMADNAFTFLKFPMDWRAVLDEIATYMAPNGLLVFRCFSIPPNFPRKTVAELINDFEISGSNNFTALRTQLLYSQLDVETSTINTESVLSTYEKHQNLFESLLRRTKSSPHNDLESVKKYKDCGITYSVPGLSDILDLVGKHFHIKSVNYGEYALADSFPLIVASKK